MKHADVEEMNYLRRNLHASINNCITKVKQRNIMFPMTTTYTNLLKETQ